NDSTKSTVPPLSTPSASGRLNQSAMATTAGMVRPMHATALPNARLMLVCSRLPHAAPIAAPVSGNSTIAATITPASLDGAPTAAIPVSIDGASDFANSTTAVRDRTSNSAASPATRAEGGGTCAADPSATAG